MSVTTAGQLCFGVCFEEGYKFPWDAHGYYDMDQWWLLETGWICDPELNPWTPEGEYKPGFSYRDPRVDAYYQSKSNWLKSHSLPVALVNYQSVEVPAYILAAPSTVKTAYRGYPEIVNPSALSVGDEVYLLHFCSMYGLEFVNGPAWFLSSFWG